MASNVTGGLSPGMTLLEVVRPPLAALDKWRDQLSSEQIAWIEPIVCHAEVGRRFFEGP